MLLKGRGQWVHERRVRGGGVVLCAVECVLCPARVCAVPSNSQEPMQPMPMQAAAGEGAGCGTLHDSGCYARHMA